MKVHLTAARRPMLAGNMTRAELVREAEHLFPNPSPIVQRMIQELRGDVRPVGHEGNHATTPIVPDVMLRACTCPACGSPLTAELQG